MRNVIRDEDYAGPYDLQLEVADDEIDTLQDWDLIADKCGDCSNENMTVFHPLDDTMTDMKAALEELRGRKLTNT